MTVSAPKHGKTPQTGDTITTPGRGRCIVRRVETPESYAGSKIVLPEVVRDRITAQQVEILAVGFPALCDVEDCPRNHVWDTCGAAVPWPSGEGWDLQDRFHPPRLHVGDWALIAPRSLVDLEDGTFLVRQDDVLAVLNP